MMVGGVGRSELRRGSAHQTIITMAAAGTYAAWRWHDTRSRIRLHPGRFRLHGGIFWVPAEAARYPREKISEATMDDRASERNPADPRELRLAIALTALAAVGITPESVMVQAALWWQECLEPVIGRAGPSVGWENTGRGPRSSWIEAKLLSWIDSGVLPGDPQTGAWRIEPDRLAAITGTFRTVLDDRAAPLTILLDALVATEQGRGMDPFDPESDAASLLRFDPVYRCDPWLRHGPGHACTSRAPAAGALDWVTGNQLMHAVQKIRLDAAGGAFADSRRGELAGTEMVLTGAALAGFLRHWAQHLRATAIANTPGFGGGPSRRFHASGPIAAAVPAYAG